VKGGRWEGRVRGWTERSESGGGEKGGRVGLNVEKQNSLTTVHENAYVCTISLEPFDQ